MGEVKVVAYISETAMNIALKHGERYCIGPHQDAVMKPLVTLADHAEAMRGKDAEIERLRSGIEALTIIATESGSREALSIDKAKRAEAQRDACVAALKKCLAQLEILVPDRGMVHDELMAILDARAAIASAEKGEL